MPNVAPPASARAGGAPLPPQLPSLDSVRAAATALSGVVPATACEHDDALTARLGVPVRLKREDTQTTGSFKVRGAYTVLDRLAPSERARGVVASSAGNHGLGLAWAAQRTGTPATLYVPRDAPEVKKAGIAALGTSVNDEAADYDDAMVRAKAHAAREGIPFVNPCLGLDLLAGQGTVALEILQQVPDVRTVFVCVGGGGLLGGVGAVLRRLAPHVRIVGAQSVRTAAMARSLAAGTVVPIASEPTLADGLAGQIDDDALAIGRATLDDIVLLEESEIAETITWLHDTRGIRAEGAGAVAVGALRHRVADGRTTGPSAVPVEGPVVAIVSGRNIDEARLTRLRAGHVG